MRLRLFVVLTLALCAADLLFFFLALFLRSGVAGIIVWASLHVFLGCTLLRAAARVAPIMPHDYDADDFYWPAARHDAQGDPGKPFRSGHETAAAGASCLSPAPAHNPAPARL